MSDLFALLNQPIPMYLQELLQNLSHARNRKAQSSEQACGFFASEVCQRLLPVSHRRLIGVLSLW